MCLCVCVLGKIGSQRLDYYISDLKYMFELKEGRDTHIRAHSHTHITTTTSSSAVSHWMKYNLLSH